MDSQQQPFMPQQQQQQQPYPNNNNNVSAYGATPEQQQQQPNYYGQQQGQQGQQPGAGGGGSTFVPGAPQGQQQPGHFMTTPVPVPTVQVPILDGVTAFPASINRRGSFDRVGIPYNKILVVACCVLGGGGWALYIICRVAFTFGQDVAWVFVAGAFLAMAAAFFLLLFTRRFWVEFDHGNRMCSYGRVSLNPVSMCLCDTRGKMPFDQLGEVVTAGDQIQFRNPQTGALFPVQRVVTSLGGGVMGVKQQWENYIQEIKQPGSVAGTRGWCCSGVMMPVQQQNFTPVVGAAMPPPQQQQPYAYGQPQQPQQQQQY